ncbi:MAG: hypothetical protein NC038_05470 [Paludibacter sp.]|nr:hypothetical protein [Bacteroidales bacterium]MCM1069820.1 hypothetical protein [Prevotella sp.]MCM1353986.1 hypothetical protein [Bacteroides sp.]MCM1443372.1 hypothetical protein [Muribaculum sp.]MCM1482075.1 hypothetical protein [Paludibacter sp.]
MTTFEIISLVLNILFVSGGIVTLCTLKATRHQAEAEANNTEAKAEGTQLENDEKASKIILQYVVDPLKKEISYLRKDVRALNRAIGKIGECPHADECPVLRELQKHEEHDDDNRPFTHG